MKNIYGRVAIALFLATLMYLGWSQFSQKPIDKRAAYAEFLANHPFNQRDTDPEKWENLPKADRPDLAGEQNFIMTMDPAL